MARTVSDCARMLEALAPELDRSSRTDAVAGTAWAEHCRPLVADRVGAAAELLDARSVDFPLPTGLGPAFMAEVADVHRDLFAENAESYGANVRAKIERCLALTESEIESGRRARAEYADRALAAMDGYDLLLVPTLPFVAPPLPGDELEIREDLIRFTLPFNALGWPALSLPAGPAEDGLPASIQLVGRPGTDPLVLAVGAELEASLGALGRPREGRQAAGAQDSA
jgi:Asp-tRNA(Asn)/Glu-tRNA(Gln) amidotransferase A subunit family amidase